MTEYFSLIGLSLRMCRLTFGWNEYRKEPNFSQSLSSLSGDIFEEPNNQMTNTSAIHILLEEDLHIHYLCGY